MDTQPLTDTHVKSVVHAPVLALPAAAAAAVHGAKEQFNPLMPNIHIGNTKRLARSLAQVHRPSIFAHFLKHAADRSNC